VLLPRPCDNTTCAARLRNRQICAVPISPPIIGGMKPFVHVVIKELVTGDLVTN
jgi:hypothetical protein